jgi:hypothetical protein
VPHALDGCTSRPSPLRHAPATCRQSLDSSPFSSSGQPEPDPDAWLAGAAQTADITQPLQPEEQDSITFKVCVCVCVCLQGAKEGGLVSLLTHAIHQRELRPLPAVATVHSPVCAALGVWSPGHQSGAGRPPPGSPQDGLHGGSQVCEGAFPPQHASTL